MAVKEKESLARRSLRMLWSIAFILIGSYIGFGVLLFIIQKKIIFHPSSDFIGTPDAYQLDYEDVTLDSGDGTKINGWYIPCSDAKLTVLFCHGNAGNISHRIDTAKLFHDAGANVFLYDYRGFGKSEGQIAENGLYMDTESAWRWLKENKGLQDRDIVIVGRSLGGAMAAQLASRVSPRGLVLESAFFSTTEVARDYYKIYPANLLTRIKLPTGEYLAKVNCPKLLMHSLDDEIIPYRHSSLLFEQAKSPKTFVELSGTHNDCYFTDPQYLKSISLFFNSLLREQNESEATHED